MWKVELQKAVFDGFSKEKSQRSGVLYKSIELPFPPSVGVHITFPKHPNSSLAGLTTSAEITLVSWNTETSSFSCQCKPHFLLDLENPELGWSDLEKYLGAMVQHSWDRMFIIPEQY